jgi:hypothetical protein
MLVVYLLSGFFIFSFLTYKQENPSENFFY